MKDISLSKDQIREFLDRLASSEGCLYDGVAERCGGPDFIFAKKILTSMGIDKAVQEKILELCKDYGGYCDCEILMNAAPNLLGEETPW